MSRISFLPLKGWCTTPHPKPVVFDPELTIPPDGMSTMLRLATLAETSNTEDQFRESILAEGSGPGKLQRLATVAAMRLVADYPGLTRKDLESPFPGSLLELDREALTALWPVMRVMCAREKAQVIARDLQNGQRLREVGGDLLASHDTAYQLALTNPQNGVAFYETLTKTLGHLVEAAELRLMDEIPEVPVTDESMPPIGSYQLTEEQADAALEILRNFRHVRQLCRDGDDHQRLPWTSLKLDSPDWYRVDRSMVYPRAMVMAGGAGVGKSYTLLYLTLRLMQESESIRLVALTAYTHTAARVIDVYFEEAFARLAVEMPELEIEADNTYPVDYGEGRVRIERVWRVNVNGIIRHILRPKTLMSTYTMFVDEDNPERTLQWFAATAPFQLGINDESSMVPREYLRALVGNAPHPVLLVGDPGQIRPVGEAESSTKPDMYSQLVAEGYGGRVGAFANLMKAKNQRTKESGAGALYVANSLREHIALPPTFGPEKVLRIDESPLTQLENRILEAAADDQYQGISQQSEDQAVADYVDTYWLPDHDKVPSGAAVIISGTHNIRSRINRIVRQKLGFQKSGRLAPGETLIVESPRRYLARSTGRTPTDFTLANNEFIWVEDVINADEKVPIQLSDMGHEERHGERVLMGLEQEKSNAEGKQERPEKEVFATISCAHCVVRTATGETAEVMIPHATLETSPKVKKAWGDEYAKIYQKLRKAVERLMKSADMEPRRVGTYATLALWDREQKIVIPRPNDPPLERTWREMRIATSRKWKFDDRLRLFFIHGRRHVFTPKMSVEMGERDERIIAEMQAWRDTSLLLAHPAYCITGHASQGSQFKTVYTHLEPPSIYRFKNATVKAASAALQEALRWLYVVMTRAENELVVIGTKLSELDRDPKQSASGGAPGGEGEFVPLPKRRVTQQEADELFS